MAFNANSIVIEEIREDTRYGGLRARIAGLLGKARCAVQLDIGYGDAVATLAEGLARAAFMLAITVTPHLLWQRRQRLQTTA